MMPLSEILVLGLLAYFAYRLIFDFFLPIIKTTRHVRRQFRDIHDAFNGNPPGQKGRNFRPNNGGQDLRGEFQGTEGHSGASQQKDAGKPTHSPSFDSIGEYIDFEEIKK